MSMRLEGRNGNVDVGGVGGLGGRAQLLRADGPNPAAYRTRLHARRRFPSYAQSTTGIAAARRRSLQRSVREKESGG